MLAAVGARLASTIRAADTVARVGGDEFAILLGSSPDSDPVATACHIHDLLEPPFVFEGKEVFAHASIGIAFADAGDHGVDGADQLLRNADIAMYIAKQHGKAQCRIFEPAMHQSVYDRLELRRDLELAIDRGELQLHYQPIVYLATGAITGYEALLRWNHPTRGPISPAEFIPIAEETGLIVRIGRRVLEAACRDGVRLNAVVAHDDVRVGVNLSGRQLQRPEMVEEVRVALARSGLPAELLVLELTESVMMKDVDLSTERLGDLKALGVLLALDDFGTGYSSLNYIQRFPVDILKIDKSFTDVARRRAERAPDRGDPGSRACARAPADRRGHRARGPGAAAGRSSAARWGRASSSERRSRSRPRCVQLADGRTTRSGAGCLTRRGAYDVTMMSFWPALSAPQGIAFTSNCVTQAPADQHRAVGRDVRLAEVDVAAHDPVTAEGPPVRDADDPVLLQVLGAEPRRERLPHRLDVGLLDGGRCRARSDAGEGQHEEQEPPHAVSPLLERIPRSPRVATMRC